jgi:hypothetical protein
MGHIKAARHILVGTYIVHTLRPPSETVCAHQGCQGIVAYIKATNKNSVHTIRLLKTVCKHKGRQA